VHCCTGQRPNDSVQRAGEESVVSAGFSAREFYPNKTPDNGIVQKGNEETVTSEDVLGKTKRSPRDYHQGAV